MSNQQNDEYNEVMAEAQAEMAEANKSMDLVNKELGIETPAPIVTYETTSKKEYPKYQYSIFLKNGKDEQLVIRSDSFEELVEAKKNIEKIMEKRADTVTSTVSTKDVVQDGCPHTNVTLKKSTGFKNPANAGRIYNACLDCGKFISWKEQNVA